VALSVCLTFDARSEATLRGLWRRLEAAGVTIRRRLPLGGEQQLFHVPLEQHALAAGKVDDQAVSLSGLHDGVGERDDGDGGDQEKAQHPRQRPMDPARWP